MKILISGAAGLLGAEISTTLEKHREKLGISQIIRHRASPSPQFVSADLRSREGLQCLAKLDWDYLIHCAAEKDPDFCETHKAEADSLNVKATAFLAETARQKNAGMLYISTDYVFPGNMPPYAEDDDTLPVNHYGATKLEGERLVLQASPRFISLRVPILYGTAAGVERSAVLAGSIKALLDHKEKFIDNAIIRYPTWTGDVAGAVAFLIGKDKGGIFHCTGNCRNSKYQICVDIAETLGLSHSHVYPLESPPQSAATRPYDSHLSMSGLSRLGFPEPLPFRERLKSLKQQLSRHIAGIN